MFPDLFVSRFRVLRRVCRTAPALLLALACLVSASSSLADSLNFAQATSYAYSGQDRTGSVTVLDGGAGIRLQGNRVRAFQFPYVVTPSTRMSFSFSSSVQGELHSIGLDADLWTSSGQIFQLYGTQWMGKQDFRNYVPSVPGEAKQYDIPIGEFFTGSMNYVVLIMDHDVLVPTGESIFRDVRVYEAGSNMPPSVNFALPTSDLTVVEGEPQAVTLDVGDDGEIAYCDLLVNGQLQRRGTVAPFQYNRFIKWLTPGNYELRAACADTEGLVGTATHQLTVVAAPVSNTPPSVAFTLPASDLTVVEGLLQPVELGVSDDGEIAYCDMYYNGQLQRRATVGPYAYNRFVKSLAPGDYELRAECKDTEGLVGTATRQLTVAAAPPSNTPPSVDFTLPTSDLTVAEGESQAVALDV
ncbi:MAG: hypothetical protein KJP25_01490, partial [Gammaproteobacteria bacterium]|nr:hypothetical protein [Gammaproteobacteria bacterium]